MSPPVGEDFEPWLQQELRQAVGSVRGPSPRADQAGYRRVAARGRGPLALVGAKGAVIMAAAALAVGLGATGATAQGGQNAQSGRDEQTAHSSAAGKPPHPTDPPKRPSPKPRPTPGGG